MKIQRNRRRSNSSKNRLAPHRPRRLLLEPLEDRLMLSYLVHSGEPSLQSWGSGLVFSDQEWTRNGLYNLDYPNWGKFSVAGGVDADGDGSFGMGSSAGFDYQGSLTVNTQPEEGEMVGDPVTIWVLGRTDAAALSFDEPAGSAHYGYSAAAPAGGGTLLSGQQTGGTWLLPLQWGSYTFTTTIGTPFEVTFTAGGNVAAPPGFMSFAHLQFSFAYEIGIDESPQPDIVARALGWDTSQAGVELSYSVVNEDLPQTTTATLYWSPTDTFDANIATRVYETTINTGQGAVTQFVPNSVLGDPPAGTTHLLLVVDPDNLIEEFDEENNTLPLRIPDSDIEMLSATTEDSQSVKFEYEITGDGIDQFQVGIYRSEDDKFDPADVPMVDLFMITDTSPGTYTHTEPNIELLPDPKHKYILVVADPDDQIEEADDNNEAFFKKHLIGVVTHGYVKPGEFPEWVAPMAAALMGEGYDDAQPKYWVEWSREWARERAVAAGQLFATDVVRTVSNLSLSPNDVVDVHWIGHSRGAVVISEALKGLAGVWSSLPEQLQHGYTKMTMLDPHPARNRGLLGEVYSDHRGAIGALYYFLARYAQDKMRDPEIVVPGIVDLAEVYYQKTLCEETPTLREQFLNLWGEEFTPAHEYNRWTGVGTGHGEVPERYQYEVISRMAAQGTNLGSETRLVAAQASDSGSETRQDTEWDVNVLYPAVVDDRSVAEEIAGYAETVVVAYEEGNWAVANASLASLLEVIEVEENHIDPEAVAFLTWIGEGMFDVISSRAADQIGVFSSGYWWRDINRNLVSDSGDGSPLVFGWNGATPVTGDWNGDGTDEIGVYAGGAWYLDANGNGTWDGSGGGDAFFYYGWSGATPVVGDWNGDGTDDVGVYNLGVWFRDVNGNRQWDSTDASSYIYYGWSGAIPVVGNWNGDGVDDVGIYNLGGWFRDVNGSNSWDSADQSAFMFYGWNGPTPVSGDWNGDGSDDVGVYAGGSWLRDVNGNNIWDGPDQSAVAWFGSSGQLPVVGVWPSAGYAIQASSPPTGTQYSGNPLTDEELQPTVTEAIARWAAVGLEASILDKLARIEFVIADLPGSYLGKAKDDRIYIDSDAAGYGWFVDSTPTVDEEFPLLEAHSQLRALDPRAVDRMDLLTVVEHELGHIAGFDDLDALVDDLMSGVLGTGIRRTPRWADVDGFFASGKIRDWHLHSC